MTSVDDDQAERLEGMSNGFAFPHAGPAGAGDRPLDQVPRRWREMIRRGQDDGHAVKSLAGEPLGQGKTGRKRRAGVESCRWPEPDQEDRVASTPGNA